MILKKKIRNFEKRIWKTNDHAGFFLKTSPFRSYDPPQDFIMSPIHTLVNIPAPIRKRVLLSSRAGISTKVWIRDILSEMRKYIPNWRKWLGRFKRCIWASFNCLKKVFLLVYLIKSMKKLLIFNKSQTSFKRCCVFYIYYTFT